jgi:hypothetical protein
MTASPVHWITSVLHFGPNRRQYPTAIRHRARSQASPTNELGRVHSIAHGCPSRHRFLYCRSSDLERIEDLLCPVLPASRDSTRHHRGITRHPTEQWITQMARNAVDEIDGVLRPVRFALHDRDSKFCASFRAMLRSGGVQPLLLPAQSPNLKGYASHCTSRVRCGANSFARRRWESFTPWALCGG